MRTANPVLKSKAFDVSGSYSEPMTINGVVNKSAALLGILILSAYWIWDKFYTNMVMGEISTYMFVGILGGLVVALITTFKPNYSMYTAPLYALLEGLALGGISAFLEARYPGIVIQAVALTFATLFSLLAAYRSGLIRVTENFKLMVTAATGGIFIVYMLSFVLNLFGTQIPFIHDSGLIGIIFSLVVVAVAAMNLVLDFDFIEQGAEKGAPKFMEWYAAFGLLVTLVWLYLEILRLLSKSRR
ncbi:MAG: Bax inhibitor-1/YccA family protein [Calditrichae bacterium]|nr:Bax inhibitor-1/YccA family protein [Calditrichota bacterium]MCB9057539.1 Bax inhibitor-1/YccA family protein [Calditrichia bacterium]